MLRKLYLIALTVVVSVSGQVSARTDMLFSNRFYGTVSAGLGVFFLVEAKNARTDGNEAYDLYIASGSAVLAREFYDQSRQKDTKAAIMLGLGVGTITYGLHLLLKGDGSKLPNPKMDRGLVEVKGVKIDAGPDPKNGHLHMWVRRTF